MKMNNASTSISRIASAAAQAAPSVHLFPANFNPSRTSFHFKPDDGSSAGGGDGGSAGSGGAGAGGDTTPGGAGGDTLQGGAGGGAPRRTPGEIAAIAKQRDKAKGAYRATLRALGIDPDEVEIVETGDPNDPYRINGLEDVAEIVRASRDTAGAGDDDGGRPKDQKEIARRKRLTAPLEKRIKGLEREKTALIKFIRDNFVRTEIRSAARELHAVDDDGGAFADIVDLTEKRFKIDVEIDDDSHEARAMITTLDDLGEPATDDLGNALSPKAIVADLLKRKPKFRESNFVPGSGAGDRRAQVAGTPGARARAPIAAPAEKTRDAVHGFFGKRPEPAAVGS